MKNIAVPRTFNSYLRIRKDTHPITKPMMMNRSLTHTGICEPFITSERSAC